MPVVLHAQHEEDVWLRRLFAKKNDGYYVDIGANDPSFCSVTKYFYDLGWRGVNVEPVPHLAERLKSSRTRDLNLGIGISSSSGSMTFYECPLIPGWSTFVDAMAASYRRRGLPLIERAIPVITVTELFAQYIDRGVDFLKIDVEGHEPEVLRGIDWERCRPRVLVIENAWPENWAYLIPESDYLLAHCDAYNRFYVRKSDSTLLSAVAGHAEPEADLVHPDYSACLEARIARLASREDLGPLGRGLRWVLFRVFYKFARLRQPTTP